MPKNNLPVTSIVLILQRIAAITEVDVPLIVKLSVRGIAFWVPS